MFTSKPMKKSDNFQISSAWWKREKPDALLKTGLGEALTAYEAARAKVTDKPKTFTDAKTALAAVEAARKKALANCGLIFPDAKVVLGKGDAVIKAEAVTLATLFQGKVAATLGPIRDELVRVSKLCAGAMEVAQKAAAAIPAAGKQAGKQPNDAEQTKNLALAKTIAKSETLLRANISKLSEVMMGPNWNAFVQSAASGTDAAAKKALDAAKAVLQAARSQANELGDDLDGWNEELKKVDPKAEIERMFN